MKFERVWASYEKELSSFVLSRVKDKEIQKEIMQEVALKIFTSLGHQHIHLRGWLYKITKNVIADYYRKNQKALPPFEDEKFEEEEHILLECLEPMLASLKDEEREILELTQLQQYSLKEIAQMKSMPFNTVKSQLYRAKKALAGKFFTCCNYARNQRGEVVDFQSYNGGCKVKK